MKLPLINKLSAVTGIFARLNPVGLLAKIKLRKKDGDANQDEERDFLPSGGDGDDLFADLGDLDQLDAAAADKAAQGVDEDFGDFDNEELDEFDENEFDGDVSETHDPPGDDEPASADMDAPQEPSQEPMSSSASDDTIAALSDFSVGGGFDDDDEEDEDEEAQKAKLKKLAMLAGGGVVLAMVIGGLAWWLMGGDHAASPTEKDVAMPPKATMGASGDLVISLDDIAPAAQPDTSTPDHGTPDRGAAMVTPEKTSTEAVGGGLAPSSGAPHPAPQGEGGGEQSELKRLGLDVQMEPGVGVVIPAGTKASYEKLAPWPTAKPLQTAPVQTLVEQGEHGLLPKIGPEGDTPYDAYARAEPQKKSGDPKIAVIVTGLGMSRAATEAAIAAMPADVALSLDVYARGLDFWVKRARQAGHEVLLNMPSESNDFPFSDPGPHALRSLATPDENVQQLEWILSQTTGYFGVLSVYGSKFLSVEEQVKVIMNVLKQRGVMYVDGGAEDSRGTRVAYQVGAKWATVDLILDNTPGRAALDLQFQEFEALAKKRAVAIARVSANPLALERLAAWLKTLDGKGLQLVPVSSLANKQLIR